MPKKPRPVLYPKPDVQIFEKEGELLKPEDAKQLLGWTEVERSDRWMLKDENGKYITCKNVDLQRPYYKSVCYGLMWDILAENWEFNFETIIIGETGLVLDGKHRLTALILASQKCVNEPDKWEPDPGLEVLVATGAKENRKLVNTIGTGKQRSMADSLYASGLFEHEDNMKKLSKMTEYAIRLLWKRTGARDDAHNPRASHSDALDFLDRHSKIIQCVKTIYHENAHERRIERLLSGGYSSGLMYLMSTSKTNPSKYRTMEGIPSEDSCDFSMEEKAEQYWLLLAHEDERVMPVIKAIAKLSEGGNVSADERMAILVKGWNAFVKKGKVHGRALSLKIKIDDYGRRQICEDPMVGGIDVGNSGLEE